MIDNMDWFLDNLENNIQFGYARFNDGEIMAIKESGCVVARGDQIVDESLTMALREAIIYKQKNYFVGIPCSMCYNEYNKLAKDMIGEYEHLTKAVVTTNKNWKKFIDNFPKVMSNRKLIWISGDDQSIGSLRGYGLNVKKSARIPNRNSWKFYQRLKDLMPKWFEPNDVVGISLGPTARILVRHWFEEYPDITFIDMGSNLDPITRDVWHDCHKGWEETGFNLTRPCEECN